MNLNTGFLVLRANNAAFLFSFISYYCRSQYRTVHGMHNVPVRPCSVNPYEGRIVRDLFHIYCDVELFPLIPLQFSLIPFKPNKA